MEFAGEWAALATAGCWTVTALSFEAAGRRIGSLAVNLIRLLIALVFLSVFGYFVRGFVLPSDAGAHAWIWLSVSGLVGFCIGDLALFRAFVLIGARVSMLLMSLVPPMAALIGWGLMGEILSGKHWLGMGLVLSGIAFVILERQPDPDGNGRRRPLWGIVLGVLAALGQAVGLVLSKYGMRDYDPFAATQIRVIAGIVGFSVLYSFIGWWPKIIAGFKNSSAMKRLGVGSFFGPFLGVSMSLYAVQNAQAGVAATIMSITPVLIIVPAALLFKEKITLRSIIGAGLAIGGVALMFS
jgi:drug/metabolite transporter (DMT)-like permease